MDTKEIYILIAEDEMAMGRALQMKLQHLGFTAENAFNGEEAINVINEKKEKIHMILLDLMMPTIDGFGVLKYMNEKKITTPVIVMSNLGQTEDIKRAKEMGAKGYFIKSETPIKDLVTEIEAILEL
jgi:DNA-binding response OmpR family regulator